MKNKKSLLLVPTFLFTNIPAFPDETYDVSWNTLTETLNIQINSGAGKLINPVLILLGLLTVIRIIYTMTRNTVTVPTENLISDLIGITVSFSLYSYIIKNIVSVTDLFLDIFIGIGQYFASSSDLKNLDSVWDKVVGTTAHMYSVINDWAVELDSIAGGIKAIMDIEQFIQNFVKVLLLFLAIIFIYYVFIRVMVEILMAILQFRLGLALAMPFLSTEVIKYLKPITGGKFLTVLFTAGLKITVSVMFLFIFTDVIDRAKFTDSLTIDTIEIQNIFLFIAVGFMMAFLINKGNETVSKLSAQ